MRPWFVILPLSALFTLSCAQLSAQPPLVEPPRTERLEQILTNTDTVESIRIEEAVWLRPYPVSAAGGLGQVRSELDTNGPWSQVAQRRFAALTSWGLNWSFTYDDSADACSVRNAAIEVEAVITLPELVNESGLSPGDFNLWQSYLEQLRAHEDGHVNIYRAGARELRDEILQTGSMADCELLRRQLSALAEAKLERLRAADVFYDRETGHGVTFPK